MHTLKNYRKLLFVLMKVNFESERREDTNRREERGLIISNRNKGKVDKRVVVRSAQVGAELGRAFRDNIEMQEQIEKQIESQTKLPIKFEMNGKKGEFNFSNGKVILKIGSNITEFGTGLTKKGNTTSINDFLENVSFENGEISLNFKNSGNMKINPEQLAEFIVNSLNSKNLNSGHIYLDNGFELQLVTKEYVVENLNNIDRFIAMKKRAGLSSDIDKRTLEERKMLINQLNAFRRMS